VARIPIFGKGCPRDAFAPFLGYCYPHMVEDYGSKAAPISSARHLSLTLTSAIALHAGV
jgi:hypothetical protein